MYLLDGVDYDIQFHLLAVTNGDTEQDAYGLPLHCASLIKRCEEFMAHK
jgi:hypothetical protein